VYAIFIKAVSSARLTVNPDKILKANGILISVIFDFFNDLLHQVLAGMIDLVT